MYNYVNIISIIFDRIVNLWNFKIISLDSIECSELKAKTLYPNSVNDIWKNRYRENMVNILNYQIETNAPIWTLCSTCWYLLDSLAGDYDFVEINLLKSALTLISYIREYWSWDRIIKLKDDFFEGDNDDVLPIDDFSNKKNSTYNVIWAYLTWAYLWRNRYEWEKVKIEWDFCDVLKKFYNIVWQEFFLLFYGISKYEVHGYCLEWVLYENNYKNLYYIYSPKWLSKLSNHPILKYKESEIVSIFSELKKWCIKIFWEKYSSVYIDFLFDSAYINIFRNSWREDKQLKAKLVKFLKKYEYIDVIFLWNKKWLKIANNDLVVKFIKDWEKNFMISQWLYFNFIKDQIIIKEKLEKKDLRDFSSLFYLMQSIWQSNWYIKCKDYYTINNKLKIYREEFELSRLFLYQKIWKEQFDWLHSVYNDTIWEFRLRNLYNLVLGKFSLAFLKYWVDYFTEWYLLFLKQVFKNIWLWTPDDWLEKFDLPKEKWNDFWILELDNEEILSLLSMDESLNLEFKASFSLDWKNYLKSKKEEECEFEKHKIYPFLKPIVSMLNSHWWSIIVWAWEKLKVEEAIKKWDIDGNNLKYMVDFNKNLYLTWVNGDFKFFWWNEDNAKQKIDKLINDKIDPSPNSVWCHIEINFFDVSWRKIWLLTVPNAWDKVFFLKEYKDKQIIKKLYIRNNANDEELKDPEKIVNFTKSKSIKW